METDDADPAVAQPAAVPEPMETTEPAEPANDASLGDLRAQARALRQACAAGDPAALARLRAVSPGAGPQVALGEAQLVIAREYGFDGWRELAGAAVRRQSGGRDMHRWFAVELNNAVWDQLDAGLSATGPADEREQALYAAYAASYHWMQAGNVANRGRAEHLVAAVAAAVGEPALAARHATRYAELIAAEPDAFADWDRAFAAEAGARAAALAGAPEAEALKARARRLAEEVADPEDRRVCLDRLAAEPW